MGAAGGVVKRPSEGVDAHAEVAHGGVGVVNVGNATCSAHEGPGSYTGINGRRRIQLYAVVRGTQAEISACVGLGGSPVEDENAHLIGGVSAGAVVDGPLENVFTNGEVFNGGRGAARVHDVA